MNTYELYEKLLQTTGKKTADVARATGISTGAFTQWKQSKMNFKADKLQLIADYFNVPLTYFYPDAQADGYYDTDTLAYAQMLKERPELKVLCDVSRSMSAEKLESVIRMLEELNK